MTGLPILADCWTRVCGEPHVAVLPIDHAPPWIQTANRAKVSHLADYEISRPIATHT